MIEDKKLVRTEKLPIPICFLFKGGLVALTKRHDMPYAKMRGLTWYSGDRQIVIKGIAYDNTCSFTEDQVKKLTQ